MNSTPDTIELKVRGASRKRFAIDGDPNNVIELNTSDIGILDRIHTYLPKLEEIEKRAMEIKADNLISDDGFNTENTQKFLDELNDCNTKMQEYIDAIFNATVAKACSAGGTMYDPVEGEPRYMVIIADLSAVYQNDLAAEVQKINKRRQAHTKKYTKKK